MNFYQYLFNKRKYLGILFLTFIALQFLGYFFWSEVGIAFHWWNNPSLKKLSVNQSHPVTSSNNSSVLVTSVPEEDRKKLINLKDFQFLMNPAKTLCAEKQPFLITLIVSSSGNTDYRKAIRETWAKSNVSAAYLFLLGWSKQYQKSLIEENEIHKDFIQGNFVDSYRNLTYKHAMLLKWVKYYCPSVTYVLKVDDDVFVDMPALANFLTSNSLLIGKDHRILCNIYHEAKPFRNPGSKWKVTREEYSEDYYPDYCGGFVVLYRADAIFALYDAAQKEPYFWIEDVHITGMVREKAFISLTPIYHLFSSRQSMTKLFKAPKDSIQSFVFGPMNLKQDEIRKLYEIVSHRTT